MDTSRRAHACVTSPSERHDALMVALRSRPPIGGREHRDLGGFPLFTRSDDRKPRHYTLPYLCPRRLRRRLSRSRSAPGKRLRQALRLLAATRSGLGGATPFSSGVSIVLIVDQLVITLARMCLSRSHSMRGDRVLIEAITPQENFDLKGI